MYNYRFVILLKCFPYGLLFSSMDSNNTLWHVTAEGRSSLNR